MKIEAVEIQGFGKWSQLTLSNLNDFQIITGSNESGKSTLRAFITGVLFGFPTKGKYNNLYEPLDGSQYGGSLTVKVFNQTYKITRIGRIQSELTVKNLEQEKFVASPQKWLDDHLNGLDLKQFETIYSFDGADLSHIKTLSTQDLENLLLNLGTSGAGKWLYFAQQLGQEANRRYTPSRVGKRPLNHALKSYENHQQDLVQLRQALPDYIAREKKLRQLQETAQQIQTKIEQYRQRVTHLQELVSKYELYQEAVAIRQEHLQKSVQSIEQSDYQTAQQLALKMEALTSSIAKLQQGNQEQPLQRIILSAPLQVEIQQYRQLKKQAVLQEQLQQELATQFKESIPPSLSAKDLEKLVHQPGSTWLNWGLNLMVVVLLSLKASFYLVACYLVFVLYWDWHCYKNFRLKQRLLQQYEPLTVDQIVAIQPQLRDYYRKKKRTTADDNQLQQLRTRLVDEVAQRCEEHNLAFLSDQFDDILLELETEKNAADQLQRLTLLTEYQDQLTQLTTQQQKILKRYQLADMSALMQALARYQNQQRYQQRYDDIDRQINLKAVATDLAAYPDRTILQAAQNQAHSDLENLQADYTQTRATIAELKVKQIRTVSNDQYLQQQQELKSQEGELIESFTDYLAGKLAAQWIQNTLANNAKDHFHHMQQRATRYFSELTMNHYSKIIFDNQRLQVVNGSHRQMLLSELSTGTKEQLYVALRLALAESVGQLVQLPLLIDDGFVNFDDQRQEQVLSLLQNVARNRQVIYWAHQYQPNASNVIDLDRMGER